MTVYIVGLDGATFDLIDRWEDDLPHLRRLREEGAHGELETVTPPITPAAWSSFMTGKNPGKHGIYDFSVRVPGEENTFELVTSEALQTYTFYEYLNDQNLTVGSFNIPLTYPPLPVDRYLVSGDPIPEFSEDTAHPSRLWEELAQATGVEKHAGTYTGENEEEYIAAHHDQIQKFRETFTYLRHNYDTDLQVFLLPNTDSLSHWMWKYHDDSHPDHPAEKAADYGDAIHEVYRRADELVGDVLEEMDDEDYLIVMSDHGFGGVHKAIYVNNVLHRAGLLQFRRRPGTWFRRLLFRIGIDLELADRLGTRLGLKGRARKGQKQEDGDGLLVRLAKSLFLSAEDIDWERTEAYARGNFGQIFINQSLPEERREAVKETVEEALYSITDPDTGEQVITDILERDDLYTGTAVDRAPDLVFLTNGWRYMPARHFEFGSRDIISDSPVRNGHHRMNGIFYVFGPDISSGEEIGDAHITDVAPTAIHCLGQPVPDDMDGEVLTAAFTTDQDITYIDYAGDTSGLDI